ncbi:DUF2142 domain-containing protein [Arthrobacter sp. M4]|uniref:DUF2142 domain-containing protein n=1 Tax=Arthrobacter sp. M4 TaxID=218160 RepID=UPI001CDB61FA|nr:DUF2142 domain-containing protein [Arthrobacter sp. M4]MCA4132245.1 DUF2142 domain-containing protein [Arthrobacter sp. M4]
MSKLQSATGELRTRLPFLGAGSAKADVLPSPGQMAGPATGVFLRIFALLAGLMVLWSLATPLMAFPDEPAHTVKAAAVARGQILVQPGESYGHGVHVQVPSYIANLQAQNCFSFAADKTAGCAPGIASDDDYLTIGVTSAGLYNPMYYWIVGLPTLFMSGAPAIFGMRIMSALISAAMYAAGFTALSRLRHPKWPVVAASVAMTPMILFLASGINPNSLEVSATMAAFCGFLVVLENSSKLRVVRPAVITVGAATAALANTRTVSLAWLLCALIVAALIYRWKDIGALFRNKLVLVTVALTAVGVALGMVWNVLMLYAPPSAGEAPAGISNLTYEIKPHNAFLTMIDRAFDFVAQYIGVMGWLESPVPQAVFMFWNMLLMLVLLFVFLVRHFRLQLGFLAALGMLLIVPSLMQSALVGTVGFVWQGRYSLPLFLVAVIAAGMAFRFRRFPHGRSAQSMTRLFLFAAVVAHAYGFIYVLRRYVVGLTGNANWQTMITVPGWQPPFTWEVLTLAYTAILLVGAGMLFSYLHPGERLFAAPRLHKQLVRFRTRRSGKAPAKA